MTTCTKMHRIPCYPQGSTAVRSYAVHDIGPGGGGGGDAVTSLQLSFPDSAWVVRMRMLAICCVDTVIPDVM